MGVWADFKAFVIKTNLVAMATAFVVGLAVTALIMAVVDDVINPLVAAAFNVNFNDLGRVLISNGNYLEFGTLFAAILNFVILIAVVFFLFVYPYTKAVARMQKNQAATTRKCPFCYSDISVGATRCAFCTSTVTPTGAPPS